MSTSCFLAVSCLLSISQNHCVLQLHMSVQHMSQGLKCHFHMQDGFLALPQALPARQLGRTLSLLWMHQRGKASC